MHFASYWYGWMDTGAAGYVSDALVRQVMSAFSIPCIFMCPGIHWSTSFTGLVVRKLCVSLARLRIEEMLYFSSARSWSTGFESLKNTTLCSFSILRSSTHSSWERQKTGRFGGSWSPMSATDLTFFFFVSRYPKVYIDRQQRPDIQFDNDKFDIVAEF